MKCSKCGSTRIDVTQKDHSTAGQIIGGLIGIGAAIISGGAYRGDVFSGDNIGRTLGAGVTDKVYKCKNCGHEWTDRQYGDW